MKKKLFSNTAIGKIAVSFFLMFCTVATATQRKASTFGFNSSDATTAFINALKSTIDTIIIDKQTADWNVGPMTISGVRNKVIIFESGVVLKAIRGRFNDRNASLLKLLSPVNVTILGYGARFKMDKNEYITYQSNTEYRHNLYINGGNGITVKGLTIEESGGDGIYITGDNGLPYARNVLLEDLNVINHGRDAISIISVDGLTVKNCSFSGTKSNVLGCGINFEPNTPDQRLSKIRFEGCRAFENFLYGV